MSKEEEFVGVEDYRIAKQAKLKEKYPDFDDTVYFIASSKIKEVANEGHVNSEYNMLVRIRSQQKNKDNGVPFSKFKQDDMIDVFSNIYDECQGNVCNFEGIMVTRNVRKVHEDRLGNYSSQEEATADGYNKSWVNSVTNNYRNSNPSIVHAFWKVFFEEELGCLRSEDNEQFRFKLYGTYQTRLDNDLPKTNLNQIKEIIFIMKTHFDNINYKAELVEIKEEYAHHVATTYFEKLFKKGDRYKEDWAVELFNDYLITRKIPSEERGGKSVSTVRRFCEAIKKSGLLEEYDRILGK